MDVSVYLDASILVAFWISDDALSERAGALLRRTSIAIVISDFASTEFASAIARHVRMGTFGRRQAHAALADFDGWKGRVAEAAVIEPNDLTSAASFIRRLDLSLRAPDAIHIAMAGRLGAELATFDEGLARCARILKQAVFPA